MERDAGGKKSRAPENQFPESDEKTWNQASAANPGWQEERVDLFRENRVSEIVRESRGTSIYPNQIFSI